MDENNSITHDFIGMYGSSRVLLKKAPEGTGIIAGGAVRDVLELLGCQDVITKCTGSRTSINMVHATFDALKNLKTVDQVAKLRGKKVEEIR